MTFIFAVFTFTTCVFASVWLTSKYKFRKQFYSDFLTFNKMLESEVRFGQKSIYALFEEIKENTDFYVSIKNKVSNSKTPFDKDYLRNDEIVYFNEYAKNIGTSDRVTQIEYLGDVTESVKEKAKFCQEEYAKYTSLYIKMGILIGLLGFIIII